MSFILSMGLNMFNLSALFWDKFVLLENHKISEETLHPIPRAKKGHYLMYLTLLNMLFWRMKLKSTAHLDIFLFCVFFISLN